MTVAAPPWVWPLAAYVHIPFCAHQCNYCDFAIAVGQDAQQERYLTCLLQELSTLGVPQRVNSVFVGGGTPTYLTLPNLERLLTGLCHWLHRSQAAEFSIEANPGTLTEEKVKLLSTWGVTRVSLGAQSFRPEHLLRLERDHVPADVPRAVESVRKHGMEVSLDLIFGVPGQTLTAWQYDLAAALALEPDHISTYGLTYEKGTPLWKQRRQGLVQALDEESERELYACSMDTLQAAGFEQYEISNFARPGKRSRHNEVYWANEAYFGFGMGAARYVQGCRALNTRDLQTYLTRLEAGDSPTFQSETLTDFERAQETMAVQLRRSAGIERAAFQQQTGYAVEASASPALPDYISLGFLSDNGRAIALTRAGKFVADSVIAGLL